MRLSLLASGSSGNAAYIESGDGGRGILVDAGLSCKRLAGLLQSIGRGLDDVGAVLLTHGHGDHTRGVRRLAERTGVEVYSAPGLGEGFGASIVEAGKSLDFSGLRALFFEVPHDTPTYGLRISDGSVDAAIATDLGEVDEETLRRLRGVEALVLEANHDEGWLRDGPYPRDLKRRVASPAGHLSNAQAADAALSLAPHGLKDLVLAHLSEKNNSPARACGTAGSVLRRAGFGGMRVRAAIAGRPTPWVEVGEPLAGSEYVYRYAATEAAGQLFEVE